MQDVLHHMNRPNNDRFDKIYGSLLGGAAGDALGYPVEFNSEAEIRKFYGDSGITEYLSEPKSGKAQISDDTQMTLFTANGILVGDLRSRMLEEQISPIYYIYQSCKDWLLTQEHSFEEIHKQRNCNVPEKPASLGKSWLLDVPELFSKRAPGNTCLTGIKKRDLANLPFIFMKSPINTSKGCGGVMRITPVALYYPSDTMDEIDQIDLLGAEAAAITHSHSLGYIPAAMLTHIINRIVYPVSKLSLEGIVQEALQTIDNLFTGDQYLDEFNALMQKAVELSKNSDSDLDNIHQLGEGWVAEETLAIAVYCSLRYQNDFSKGIIAAVNHKGDSDSTGAVTGNILGAWLGAERIDEKWKTNLELIDVISELAEDLSNHPFSANDSFIDSGAERKYVKMRRIESFDERIK